MNTIILPNIFKSAYKIQDDEIRRKVLETRYTSEIADEICKDKECYEQYLDGLFYYYEKENDFLIVIDVNDKIIILRQVPKSVLEVYMVPDELGYDDQEEVFMNYIYTIYFTLTRD